MVLERWSAFHPKSFIDIDPFFLYFNCKNCKSSDVHLILLITALAVSLVNFQIFQQCRRIATPTTKHEQRCKIYKVNIRIKSCNYINGNRRFIIILLFLSLK